MISSGFIKAIQNEMRKDDGVDGDAQRLSQLVWLIFLKVLDDDECQKQFLDSNYKTAVPEQYRWKTWASNDDGITGEALLNFVNNDLFVALKNLEINPTNRRTTVVKEVFANSFNYMKNGTQLRKVINKINDIDFNSSEDRHSFGDIYETLLASLQSAGNAGEFYTPRAITKFIVEMVNPKLGERVFDPAAGTGGFLTGAIDRIRKEVKTPEDEQLLQSSIMGVEKKQLPYTLLVTNMIFHGLEEPSGIRHDNTLARPLISYGPEDFVDVIAANPPFGGNEEDGIEDNFPSSFRTRETADLFLVLFVRLLKNGGRAGIVLPDGTLFGEGIKTRIKQHVLEECNLHTIVRLPGSVFAPYTSIATNLLFFTKGEPTKDIWYYEHRLPEGVKAYNKTKPIRLEEFNPVKDWWSNREESEVAWKVSIDEIKKRGYNLDIKNPNAKTEDELNPEDVLKNHRDKWQEIDNVADKLQQSLKQTLDHHSNKNVHYLTQNLHEYLRVPEAAKLLRKNILHLAISGQLLPQIPSEGTGEDLYRQIKAELVGNKKRKVLPEITPEEIPFDIPGSWRWARLGDLHSKVTDGSHNPPSGDPSGLPMISSRNVTDGTITLDNVRYLSEDKFQKENERTHVQSGDILLTIVGSIGRTAVVNKDHLPLTMQRSVAVLTPVLINNKYVANILFPSSYMQNTLSEEATGTAQKGVYLNQVNKLLIPLPPSAEQERIVQKTTELLNLVTELEKHIEE